jgi:hypothetical protein
LATITIGRKLNYLADSVTAAQGPSGGQPWLVAEQNILVPSPRSFLKLSYDNPDDPDAVTQIEYRLGGPSGVLVATVVITYNDEGNIDTVERI